MRGQLFSLMITILLLGSLLTCVFWHSLNNYHVEPQKLPPHQKNAPHPGLCKGCREVIIKVLEHYSKPWKRQEDNYQQFRSQLSSQCNEVSKAFITQGNTPVGSTIVYDGERKRTLEVTPDIFRTFTKEYPFPNKTFETCAVVGNGGILINSSCGNRIDSAQFVIRCNLPPLAGGYKEHVGIKTNLVTANPSILVGKYQSLIKYRRPFMESLHSYGNSLLLLPAFSFARNTPLSMRVVYTVEDFQSRIQPIFFNPLYLQSLGAFWRSQGLKELRLSTGIMMVSLALEHCANVHLYGFWPFSFHPHDFHTITNHYYDDKKPNKAFHAMPVEFELLMRLHSQGVLRLHLGECGAGEL
uniref:ST8 alpha-N-acetyl-neuraminide alpha-2,8-sialyltransferase 6 n=1 Tax=Mastacembelus armatus TaxID=205130 RepID=A0A7N8XA64_9TELE